VEKRAQRHGRTVVVEFTNQIPFFLFSFLEALQRKDLLIKKHKLRFSRNTKSEGTHHPGFEFQLQIRFYGGEEGSLNDGTFVQVMNR
jgi:hypothetical protein